MHTWLTHSDNKFERQRYSRDDITAAIEHLKSAHPTELQTVEDVLAIYCMVDVDG